MKYLNHILIIFSLTFSYNCGPVEEAQEHVDLITLDNCAGTIADDVPEFYQKYFACVDGSVSNGMVTLATDGLPPYSSMYYPENYENQTEFVSQGDGYYINPNFLSAINYTISIPANPVSKGLTINSALVDGVVGTSNEEYAMNAAGVALNGVTLFNPLAGPGDDIEDEKYSFDPYNGHPEPQGFYHYHTTSKGPLELLQSKGLIQNATVGSAEIEIYGIMCDGTIILGCTELDGATPSSSDFDAQNGHVHDITDGTTTFFENRYHTHICTETFTGHRFTPEIQYYQGCN